MYDIINKTKIVKAYEEYKIENNKNDMLGIMPKIIKSNESDQIAFTNNIELKKSFEEGKTINLYYSKRLFKCSKDYIKAVLYHEFTHIADFYLFRGLEGLDLLMSTYSEFHAMKVEFLMRCKNELKMLDDVICGETGDTTPRKEIEEYLDNILMVLSISENHSDRMSEKMEMLVNMYIRSFSWMFALLSLYEDTEKEYIESCFKRLSKYGYEDMAKSLYKEIQDINKIMENPNRLLTAISELFIACFENNNVD